MKKTMKSLFGALAVVVLMAVSFVSPAFAAQATPTATPDPNSREGGKTGAEMIKEFVDRTSSFLADDGDPADNRFWRIGAYNEDDFTERLYLQELNADVEVWRNFSKYQKFCVEFLYLVPKFDLTNINSESVKRNKNTFIKASDMSSGITRSHTVDEVKELQEAMIAAREWHWNNWQQEHRVYDPFEGYNWEDNTVVPVAVKEVATPTPTPKESKASSTPTQKPSKAAIPTATPQTPLDHATKGLLDSIVSSWVSWVLLAVVAVILGVVVYRNRKANINPKDFNDRI